MENYEIIRNITSINKKDIIVTSFFTIVCYFIIDLIFKQDFLKVILFIRFYYLIGGIAFVFLLQPIAKIYNQYIINRVYIFTYVTVAIYSVAFIKYNIIISKDNCIIGVDILTNILILLQNFLIFMVVEYKLKKYKTNTKLYIVLEIVLSIAFFMLGKNLTFNNRILLLFIQLYLNLRIIINMVKLNKISNNKSNLIKPYLIMMVIIFLISLIYMLTSCEFTILLRIKELCILLIFNVFWNLFSTNLIKKPYKELSKSLVKKTKSLDKLSKDILIKNKQLESSINELKNKEYLYETFFRFMPHPIILISLENERILFANKGFLELVNSDNIRDVINKKLSEYIYFVDPDEIKNSNFNAVLNAGNEDKFINTQFLSMYKDKMENLILIQDNTSKVLTEEIKKEVQSRIVEEKIRAEFLSSISHDLKTPINVIYSAAQLEKIYMNKENVKALGKYNSICKRNCISLIRLTNNLIDSSKINSNYLMPSLEILNVVEVVEDVVTSLVDYAKGNNTEMIFNTNKEEIYLSIDFEFIQRIILNLISNAIKFTSEKGKVEVNIKDEDNLVSISIKDNGIGMNKEFIKDAFCKYAMDEETSHPKNGTGIGLFVVKKLVELQSGVIEIETESGVGTNITIVFKKENKDE